MALLIYPGLFHWTETISVSSCARKEDLEWHAIHEWRWRLNGSVSMPFMS